MQPEPKPDLPNGSSFALREAGRLALTQLATFGLADEASAAKAEARPANLLDRYRSRAAESEGNSIKA